MASAGVEVEDDGFDELDLSTNRQLVILVYDKDSETVEIENIHDLPYPLVRGIIEIAVDQVRDMWAPWVDEDEDEDEEADDV